MIGQAKAPAGILADRVVQEIEEDLLRYPCVARGWGQLFDQDLYQLREEWRDIVLKALKEMAGAM